MKRAYLNWYIPIIYYCVWSLWLEGQAIPRKTCTVHTSLRNPVSAPGVEENNLFVNITASMNVASLKTKNDHDN